MSWTVIFTEEAKKDLKNLDSSRHSIVMKAVKKVSQNPLPSNEGGYGKPLGNKGGFNLTGYLKIKLKTVGVRVIYRIIRTDKEMRIIVVGLRANNEVYKTAEQRAKNEK